MASPALGQYGTAGYRLASLNLITLGSLDYTPFDCVAHAEGQLSRAIDGYGNVF
jgi:hypothetical protein